MAGAGGGGAELALAAAGGLGGEAAGAAEGVGGGVQDVEGAAAAAVDVLSAAQGRDQAAKQQEGRLAPAIAAVADIARHGAGAQDVAAARKEAAVAGREQGRSEQLDV